MTNGQDQGAGGPPGYPPPPGQAPGYPQQSGPGPGYPGQPGPGYPGQPGPAKGSGPGFCPACGSGQHRQESFTWWGGVLGPKLLSHVTCLGCGIGFNSKTGKSNNTAIGIYLGVAAALTIVLFWFLIPAMF